MDGWMDDGWMDGWTGGWLVGWSGGPLAIISHVRNTCALEVSRAGRPICFGVLLQSGPVARGHQAAGACILRASVRLSE